MEGVTVGILDDDPIYRKRLMEYLNHQSEYPMKAISFSDESQMKEYEREHYLEVVIGTAPKKGWEHVRWVLLGDGMDGGVDKYGNASLIARQVYDSLNLHQNVKHSLVGVYSPVGGPKRTQLALALANHFRGIYLGMEEYSSLHISSEKTEQLLFYLKEHREDIVSFFKESAVDLGEAFGYPSARSYMDYRELNMEDFQWFYEQVSKENLCVVVDIGTGSLFDLGILTVFDKVYLPMSKEDQMANQYMEFQQLLHTVEELQQISCQEIWMVKDENMNEVVKSL